MHEWKDILGPLEQFAAVAEEASFTKAAARFELSQSGLSHSISRLERKLGFKLLVRSTRSVAPTPAGERLLRTLRPSLSAIKEEIVGLQGGLENPVGVVRLTTSQPGYEAILRQFLLEFRTTYPDIEFEITISERLDDVVEGRFDAGIRLGGAIDLDMIAVRLGMERSLACVASPKYLEDHPIPKHPDDLVSHACIRYRTPTSLRLYPWIFERSGKRLQVHVGTAMIFDNARPILQAATDGLGVAYVLEDEAVARLGDGLLVRLLEEWSARLPAYHLFYPVNRQPSGAFSKFVRALRDFHRQ